MIPVTDTIQLADDELSEQFVRSSGPGGQNVNKVATTVILRFDVASSPSLADDVKERLRGLAGRRIDQDDVLQIRSGRFRTRERNRVDARERLVELIRRAAVPPKLRKKRRGESRPARARRLDEKRRQGLKKDLRGPIVD
ncbi:MAG TPA: alternative ribosome rescue aminoacyl-tRNA hydrolase ArfB [Thermoanaerobaculia bacterium]|nr:alternative ribosome rescue aminoacyl-tRNA hydrolase ArfB [Thermoanaerobaculia bacterium]